MNNNSSKLLMKQTATKETMPRMLGMMLVNSGLDRWIDFKKKQTSDGFVYTVKEGGRTVSYMFDGITYVTDSTGGIYVDENHHIIKSNLTISGFMVQFVSGTPALNPLSKQSFTIKYFVSTDDGSISHSKPKWIETVESCVN